jgi:hypothetical protein
MVSLADVLTLPELILMCFIPPLALVGMLVRGWVGAVACEVAAGLSTYFAARTLVYDVLSIEERCVEVGKPCVTYSISILFIGLTAFMLFMALEKEREVRKEVRDGV